MLQKLFLLEKAIEEEYPGATSPPEAAVLPSDTLLPGSEQPDTASRAQRQEAKHSSETPTAPRPSRLRRPSALPAPMVHPEQELLGPAGCPPSPPPPPPPLPSRLFQLRLPPAKRPLGGGGTYFPGCESWEAARKLHCSRGLPGVSCGARRCCPAGRETGAAGGGTSLRFRRLAGRFSAYFLVRGCNLHADGLGESALGRKVWATAASRPDLLSPASSESRRPGVVRM